MLKQLLAEQYLAAAKSVRANGARRSGAERELFIKKSNSFVACVSLAAQHLGGVCLAEFEWHSIAPDWSLIEDQISRLALPHVGGPPLAPCE